MYWMGGGKRTLLDGVHDGEEVKTLLDSILGGEEGKTLFEGVRVW